MLLAILRLLQERLGEQLSLGNFKSLLVVSQRVQSTSKLVGAVLLQGLEVHTFILLREELLVHNLECVTDRVVLSFQRSETRQDLIIDAFDKHNSLEWVVVLHYLVVLIPGSHCIFSLQGTSVSGGAKPGWRLLRWNELRDVGVVFLCGRSRACFPALY